MLLRDGVPAAAWSSAMDERGFDPDRQGDQPLRPFQSAKEFQLWTRFFGLGR
jgi:hypothetical protein